MNESALHGLPGGWMWTRLGDLALNPRNDIVDGPFGSDLKASEYEAKGIPIIRLQNISRNHFIKKNIRFIKPEKAEQLKRHSFSKGDIVITKLGAPLGEACIIPEDIENGIIVADVVRARTDDRLVSKNYLVYCINSESVIKQFEIKTKGTTRPRVNLNHIRELELPLPPLPEQRRIVTKLEELFTRLDAGVSELKKTQAQLKRYRQSVLKAACEGKLVPTEAELAKVEGRTYEPADVLLARILKERREKWNGKGQYKEPEAPNTSGLPEGWIRTYLDIISLKITDGEHIRPRVTMRGIPFLSAKDVRDEGILFDGSFYISEDDAKKFRNRCNPEYGDILIVSRGATVGRSCTVNIDKIFCLLGSVILIKLYSLVLNKFISYSIKSVDVQKELIGLSGSTSQQAIYIRDIRKITVALPPLAEQRRIVAEVERRLSIADGVEKTVAQSLAQAQRLRQSILKKAFEGRLVAQDANDEPAGVLLERIKQEKARLVMNKQKSKITKDL